MTEILPVLKFFTIGGILGLSSGIAPGPLLTLVISETLKHSSREGMKIAISPLFTDIPIVLASLFVFFRLAEYNEVLGVISFCGALFIAYLGYDTLTVRELKIGQPGMFSGSLKRGIVANFLSPHPYLFWITVGAPLAMKAFETGISAVILFFLSFYMALIGSKILIAHIVSGSKILLSNMIYLWIMRFLGIALFVFSCIFFFEGLKYFELV